MPDAFSACSLANLAARRKFLIPNVYQHFGVPFVDTFELLNALEARFVLGGWNRPKAVCHIAIWICHLLSFS